MKKKTKQPRKEKVRILYCYNIGIKTQSSNSQENTLNTRYSEMTAFLFAEKKMSTLYEILKYSPEQELTLGKT